MMLSIDSAVAAAQSTLSPSLQDVVSHYAPFVLAENYLNSFLPPEDWDHLLPVDFDGDNQAGNNYSDVQANQVVDGRPTVYFSIVETSNHADRGYYFINYYFYHPRDAGVSFIGIIAGTQSHDNDMEGIALIVKKTFYSPYGAIVAAVTEAHGALIPFVNPASPIPAPTPTGGGYMGDVRFWRDLNFGIDRPVVAIRSRKHGTYMAQDCSGQTPYLDMPGPTFGHWGMWLNSPQLYGNFKACIHADSHLIVYAPVPLTLPPGNIPVTRVPRTADNGTYWYRLVELANSPIWALRTQAGALLFNNLLGLTGGNVAYDAFVPSDLSSDHLANPPWAWQGGAGGSALGMYWYSFGSDNTTSAWSRQNWPESPANSRGWLVAGPVAEANLRFPGLPELAEPYRYNPYLLNPPSCCSPHLMDVKINGPDVVDANRTFTWTAEAVGGTPPYTYQWSGALSGTSQSISGAFNRDVILYLDVYDAAGQHVAVSKAISMPPLNASISGPQTIEWDETGAWSANVSGGAPPYAYKWYVDDELRGTSSTFMSDLGDPGTSHLLGLQVTDAANHTDGQSMTVLKRANITCPMPPCMDQLRVKSRPPIGKP